MCLAVPGQIVEIYEEGGLRMGKLDFGGTIRRVCLQYVPTATVGQYALIHVGFALATIEEEDAARTLALLESLGEIEGAFSGSESVTTAAQRGAP